MQRVVFIALTLLWGPVAATAGNLTAARTLPAGSIITAGDIVASDQDGSMHGVPADIVGLQTRVTLYEGRPIPASALQPPRLVERNQIVRMAFAHGALRIEAEGRAMSAGAAGDIIRVMNTASRNMISARVNPDGTLDVLN